MSTPEIAWPVSVAPGLGRSGEDSFHLVFALPERVSLSVPLASKSDGYCETTVISSCCHARAAYRPDLLLSGASGQRVDNSYFCHACGEQVSSLPSTFLGGDLSLDGYEFLSQRLERFMDHVVEPLTGELVTRELKTFVQSATAACLRAHDETFSTRWAYFKLVTKAYGTQDLARKAFRPVEAFMLGKFLTQAKSFPAEWPS